MMEYIALVIGAGLLYIVVSSTVRAAHERERQMEAGRWLRVMREDSDE